MQHYCWKIVGHPVAPASASSAGRANNPSAAGVSTSMMWLASSHSGFVQGVLTCSRESVKSNMKAWRGRTLTSGTATATMLGRAEYRVGAHRRQAYYPRRHGQY